MYIESWAVKQAIMRTIYGPVVIGGSSKLAIDDTGVAIGPIALGR